MAEEIIVRTNYPSFKADLDRFGNVVGAKIGYAATRASANVFKNEILLRAPQRTGRLKAALYVKRLKDSTRGRAHYLIGIRKGKRQRTRKANKAQREFKFKTVNLDAFYWFFLEEGWMPRGPGQKLKGGERSRRLQRQRNRAAGFATLRFPFIRPAYEAVGDQALTAFYATFSRGVERENKKRTPRTLVRMR